MPQTEKINRGKISATSPTNKYVAMWARVFAGE